VASPRPGVEQIVGFVAAALGKVDEFTQERPFLQQAIRQAGSSSSSSGSNAQPPEGIGVAAAATSLAAAVVPAEELLRANEPGGVAGGGSSGTAADGSTGSSSDALAVEVVLLGVVSGYRRQGVASRLLQQVKRHAHSQG